MQQPTDSQAIVAAVEQFLHQAATQRMEAGGPLEAGFVEIEVSFDGGKTRRSLGTHWIEPVERPDAGEDQS